MIDHRGAVYTKNETKLLCHIEPSAVCDENQTRQQRNQSIVLVYAKIEIELLGLIWLEALYDEY